MGLSRNNNRALLASSGFAECLCYLCIYNECSECPSKSGTYVDKKKYPFVKDYCVRGVNIIVTKCDCYSKRAISNPKTKTKRADFVWNSKERRFEKAK